MRLGAAGAVVLSLLVFSCARRAPEGVARGESIFFGKGKCSACHRLGARGSAVRGPALDGIGQLAESRAAEAAAKTGRSALSAADYLAESLVDPGAFVVEDFAPVMPDVSRAPIALSLPELDAVVRFLLAQGGDPGAEIGWPSGVGDPGRAAPSAAPFAEGGDPERGRAIFHDLEGHARCVGCHGLEPGGSEIGPDLREIAAIQPPEAIRTAVLEPNREIVSGYHQTVVVTNDERILIGIVSNETESGFDLVVRRTALATETLRFEKSEVAERARGQLSIMPNNYSELLSEAELRDLFAFLLTLKGDSRSAGGS